MSQNNLIYGLNQLVLAPGSLGIGTIKDEGKVRVVITGAGPSNLVRVRARIVGQQTWANLADLTGNVNELVDVLAYDQIEVICLVFDTINGLGFRIVASSFDSTALFISTPDGTLDGQNVISFISSDDTVDISANQLTGEIDFRVTGTASPAYAASFVNGDWSLVGDVYAVAVLASSHLKGVNPTVQVFEEVASVFEEVETIIEINASGDVTIFVSQVPDLRFSGKIIIS